MERSRLPQPARVESVDVAAERDEGRGLMIEHRLALLGRSKPRIADGACLAWMMFSTGATTANSPVNGALDIGWGG